MAEPRATLGMDDLERFLAGRAPISAPPALADAIVLGAASLPQTRPGWALPGFGRLAGARPALVPVVALVAIGLLLALLALASIGRPRPVVPDEAWVRRSIGDPGSVAMVIGGGGNSLLAATSPNGAPYEDTVWRSTNGVSWAPIADETPFAKSWIGGFLQLDHSVLAYGSRLDAAGKETIATWTSDDGASWQLLSDAGSTNPLDDQVRERLASVVPGGPGFVAVGSASGTTADVPSAWTSTDGVAWTRTAALDGVAVVGLVRANGGFLALTRGDRISSWRSTDGTTWSPGTFPVTVPCCGIGAMANLPGGTPLGAIAVSPSGSSPALRPSAFVTRDAETWTRIELPSPPEACVVTASWRTCPVIATAVAADAGHVVVAGSTSTTQAGPLRAVFWTSADGGRTWTVSEETPSLVLDPAQSDRMQNGIFGLWAGGPNAFYAVGRTQEAGASVWTGHPFPPAAP